MVAVSVCELEESCQLISEECYCIGGKHHSVRRTAYTVHRSDHRIPKRKPETIKKSGHIKSIILQLGQIRVLRRIIYLACPFV